MHTHPPSSGEHIALISDLANNPKTGQRGLLKVSRTTLWRMVKAGAFPAPMQVSKGIKAWKLSTVHEWLNKQQAGQGDKQ